MNFVLVCVFVFVFAKQSLFNLLLSPFSAPSPPTCIHLTGTQRWRSLVSCSSICSTRWRRDLKPSRYLPSASPQTNSFSSPSEDPYSANFSSYISRSFKMSSRFVQKFHRRVANLVFLKCRDVGLAKLPAQLWKIHFGWFPPYSTLSIQTTARWFLVLLWIFRLFLLRMDFLK